MQCVLTGENCFISSSGLGHGSLGGKEQAWSGEALHAVVGRAQASGSEAQIPQHYALWSQPSYITSLNLKFPICKMGIIIAISHKMAVKIKHHNKHIRHATQCQEHQK